MEQKQKMNFFKIGFLVVALALIVGIHGCGSSDTSSSSSNNVTFYGAGS